MSGITDSRELEKELSDLLEDVECSTCKGTGEENGEECSTCGGLGHVETADEMPDDHPDKMRALDIESARDEVTEWYDGATLIPESEFEEYAQQLAEDIGALPEGNRWPAYCIDWKMAARELAMDYSSIEIDGTDYYYRA